MKFKYFHIHFFIIYLIPPINDLVLLVHKVKNMDYIMAFNIFIFFNQIYVYVHKMFIFNYIIN